MPPGSSPHAVTGGVGRPPRAVEQGEAGTAQVGEHRRRRGGTDLAGIGLKVPPCAVPCQARAICLLERDGAMHIGEHPNAFDLQAVGLVLAQPLIGFTQEQARLFVRRRRGAGRPIPWLPAAQFLVH